MRNDSHPNRDDAEQPAGSGPKDRPDHGGADAEPSGRDEDENIDLFDPFVPGDPPSSGSSDALPDWAVDELRMLRKELFALLTQIEAIVSEMPDDDTTEYR